ncbi:MAG: hypothetical protein PCFJNLEI_02804 [Verrucomicrobiae bacterium]|nr:hypothetical protein [Verrucomicrobiae bacterium]
MRASFVVGLLLWCQMAQGEFVRIAAQGMWLPGGQLYSDAGFDLMDWNGDGRLDLFLPNPSMIAASVHGNLGSQAEPQFGRSLWYPMNYTETEPETVVFNQMQVVCDLNQDGLFDLILFDGQLRLVYNTGTTAAPNHWNLALPAPFFPASRRMLKENARATHAPESMHWGKGVFPRQVVTLTAADWDGDGLDDLLICRIKEESVATTNPVEANWTVKLPAAPARGVYFYRNLGTRAKPWFDGGVEITTPDGQSIAAPNPVVLDLDADGIADLVSTETAYACNAFRVDWPTAPAVMWYRRVSATDVARLQPAQPVLDAAKKPIPAGTQVRFADIRGGGVLDLFVQDPLTGIRWYSNTAKSSAVRPRYGPPVVLQGDDFARFGFMFQPVIVPWFGAQSRDLLLHGSYDPHCQLALRRTALYRNVATRPGEIKYAFAGFCNYRGDPALVPQTPAFERSHYNIYGSYVAVMPEDGSGKKRLVMSVGGRLYLFSDLATDGLTFQERKPLAIANPGKEMIRSCPVFVDWNSDGKFDLMLTAMTAGRAVPFEKEYRLYFNKGTNDDPRYEDYVLCRDETGQPLKLQAIGMPSVAPQCGLAVLDLNGDGKLDLVLEDVPPRTGLRVYENISTAEPHFKFVKNLGDPVPIEYSAGYRYFFLGDVDGDGVADLLNNLVYFKGASARAPLAVTNLVVAGVEQQGAELRWSKPAAAAKYDLRISDGELITEVSWAGLASIQGDYTVADGETQTVRVPLPAGKEVRIAVKSSTATGEISPLSDTATAVAAPRRRIVLQNGPAYAGTEACYVEATKPTQRPPKQPAKLEARTMTRSTSSVSPKQKMILIRFRDLPRLARLDRATLELSTDPKLERYPIMGSGGEMEISCSLIRDEWDAATATFAEAATGKPWAAGELDAGGVLLAKAPPILEVRQHQTLTWDVTRAVQEALQAGRTSVSLLVRAEYTGKYSCGSGYNFCGPDWPQAEYRPRLCLVGLE